MIRPSLNGQSVGPFLGLFLLGVQMVLIVLEVLQMLLFAGLAWMVAKLYDRIEKLEGEQLEEAEEWKPVELSDEREFELAEQERRRSYFA